MEQLKEKCESLRGLTSFSDIYEDNDIYVILSTVNNTDIARNPCSSLFITALEKLRLSAGVSRSAEEPNLILVPFLTDVPVTSNYYVHWNNSVFCQNTAVKLETVTEIFDNRYKNLNPFQRIDNMNSLALFGPRQEVMSFEFPGHEINHELMKTAIESILISVNPKFSDFLWLVYAAVYSQNCAHCLSYLLNPLRSVKELQKLVRTLTRGVWSPRSDLDMELALEWVDDNNTKFPLGCWRLDPKAATPKAPPPCSKNQESSLSFNNMRMSQHLETLKNVMQTLHENSHRLTNCEDPDEKKRQLKESKSHMLKLGLLFMKLQSPEIELSEFGFSTGTSELDEALEATVVRMLQNNKMEFNSAGLVSSMDLDTCKLYSAVQNTSIIDDDVMDKITEKLKRLVGVDITKSWQEKNNGPPEAPNKCAQNEDKNSHADSFEGFYEVDKDRISDSVVSPNPKRAKMEEVSMNDKLKMVKTAEQKDLLTEAYAEAAFLLDEIDPSHLPLTRTTDSDEFCIFCGVFIFDPSPDLSCGFHDDYQQIVNLDIKEMMVRRKFARSINEKTLKSLKQYIIQRKTAWQTAKKENTVPAGPQSRSVCKKSETKKVREKSPPKVAKTAKVVRKAKKPAVKKKRPRKVSSSSEEEFRKSEEHCIRDTLLDLPPDFDELMEEPCCSSRRVSVAMSMPEFAEFLTLKPPPPSVLPNIEPRSILVSKYPNFWLNIRDKPKQPKKRRAAVGRKRRRKPRKNVQKHPEKEKEVDRNDVSEILEKLEKEKVPTTSRVHELHDSHGEDEVRMEDVLDD